MSQPSDDELQARLLAILATADLNVVTSKKLRQQLEGDFLVDLAHRKDFINAIITGFINKDNATETAAASHSNGSSTSSAQPETKAERHHHSEQPQQDGARQDEEKDDHEDQDQGEEEEQEETQEERDRRMAIELSEETGRPRSARLSHSRLQRAAAQSWLTRCACSVVHAVDTPRKSRCARRRSVV